MNSYCELRRCLGLLEISPYWPYEVSLPLLDSFLRGLPLGVGLFSELTTTNILGLEVRFGVRGHVITCSLYPYSWGLLNSSAIMRLLYLTVSSGIPPRIGFNVIHFSPQSKPLASVISMARDITIILDIETIIMSPTGCLSIDPVLLVSHNIKISYSPKSKYSILFFPFSLYWLGHFSLFHRACPR